MSKVEVFESLLDELYPNPICELEYSKDYELLLAVMMSAQTTDKRVNSVTKVLFYKYDTLEKLKNAEIVDIGKIIRPIGTYQRKAQYIHSIATILVDQYNCIFPKDRSVLETFPGVGRKTVNVVLSVLYQEPAIAVDTHVERVSKRLGFANKDDSVLDVEKKLEKKFKKDLWSKRHHQMVFFGRYHCKAISPNCDECNISLQCKYFKEKSHKNKK